MIVEQTCIVKKNGSQKIYKISAFNAQDDTLKSYILYNDNYFTNEATNPSFNGDLKSASTSRLRLDSIRESYSQNDFLPAYKFSYDYNFTYSKTTYREPYVFEYPINTWAANPSSFVVTDMNLNGTPACWLESPQTPYEHLYGFKWVNDYGSDASNNFLTLTGITFPSGGSENYIYEPHDYAKLGWKDDIIEQTSPVIGKRISRKIVNDGLGNRQTTIYKYCLHDNSFGYPALSISSGVLGNPTIHTSVKYKPFVDNSNHEHDRYVAIENTTTEPQNSFLGQPVYYTEVEEIQINNQNETLGKNIYYFDKQGISYGYNVIYTNYNDRDGTRTKKDQMLFLGNTLYDKKQYNDPNLSTYSNTNYTYINYPIGEISQCDLTKGKVLKKICLDNQGNPLLMIENTYQSIGGQGDLYGYTVIHEYDQYENKEYPDNYAFIGDRYMINCNTLQFGYYILYKTTTTHYFPHTKKIVPLIQVQEYEYDNYEKISSVTTSVNGTQKSIVKYTYPNNIVINSSNLLSNQALTLKKMNELNIINTPIQINKSLDNTYTGGEYYTFKLLNSDACVIDSVFNLSCKFENKYIKPTINNIGNIERNPNFTFNTTFKSYDINTNPTYICTNSAQKKLVIWNKSGRSPLAVIENYPEVDLSGNKNLDDLLMSLNEITDILYSDRANVVNINQRIRSALPSYSMITTYTYNNSSDITSITDTRGVTFFYNYDSFKRLKYITNMDGKIIQSYDYNYAH